MNKNSIDFLVNQSANNSVLHPNQFVSDANMLPNNMVTSSNIYGNPPQNMNSSVQLNSHGNSFQIQQSNMNPYLKQDPQSKAPYHLNRAIFGTEESNFQFRAGIQHENYSSNPNDHQGQTYQQNQMQDFPTNLSRNEEQGPISTRSSSGGVIDDFLNSIIQDDRK